MLGHMYLTRSPTTFRKAGASIDLSIDADRNKRAIMTHPAAMTVFVDRLLEMGECSGILVLSVHKEGRGEVPIVDIRIPDELEYDRLWDCV